MYIFLEPVHESTIDLQRIQVYIDASNDFLDLQHRLSLLLNDIQSEMARMVNDSIAQASCSSSTPFPIRNTYNHEYALQENIKPFKELSSSLTSIIITLQILGLPLDQQNFFIHWMKVLYNTVSVKVNSTTSLGPLSPTSSIIKNYRKNEILEATISEFQPFPEIIHLAINRSKITLKEFLYYFDTENFLTNYETLRSYQQDDKFHHLGHSQPQDQFYNYQVTVDKLSAKRKRGFEEVDEALTVDDKRLRI
ncbi:hypothetical protein BABINDRAFT_160532 [Babjeviella inositovora NRRL Y-12698]|uniref:Uncharacterized protein n=1 Tax=Babjeviella inositovora NRRL Y-12698 TaxID=984486 RepID=A0A1E3QTW7_9ASCO|nr:uncharacterized protein BABINDRAFT_160532 [Babjeviella inositovora NRRL Y-12698]ODQ81131.1 hypothetical protein BABINDRAFT_160532 [Babjeviella inositovora NRRL Y-12698]